MLHSIFLKVQEQARAISALPAKNKDLKNVRAEVFQLVNEREEELYLILNKIEEELKWLSSGNIEDPVLLEELKLKASGLSLRMKSLTSNISDLEEHMNELTTQTTKSSKPSILLSD